MIRLYHSGHDANRKYDMMAVIIMGVSGCGKTTIGHIVAQLSQRTFIDGDNLHSQEAIDKMHHGIPLTDADRIPWLNRINAVLHTHKDAVLGCSALKYSYREIIRQGIPCWFVHLNISSEDAQRRLSSRKDHFFNPKLLASQLEVLEPLNDTELGITVKVSDNPDLLGKEIFHLLTIAMNQTPDI